MAGKLRPALSRLARFVRQHRAGFLISGATCVLSLGLYIPLYLVSRPTPLLSFLYDIELKTLDMRFRLRGERPPGSPVVIVAIDQKSEDVLGRWPFARSYFATAVDNLREAGARVIAFDANFSEPDQNSALQALQQVQKDYDAGAAKNSAFEAKLKALEGSADNDQIFANALSRFDNAILGYFFLFDTKEIASQNQKLAKDFVNYLSFQAYPQVVHPEYGKLFDCGFCQAVGLEPDLPAFAQYAKNFGFFNVVSDSDGVIRREPVVIRYQNSYYPSLDVATALAYTNRSLDQVAVVFNRNGLERVDFGPVTIPTDPDGYVQIDFHGPSGTYKTYSFADVVRRTLPDHEPMKAAFGNRIVLIGATATGIGDNRSTPFQASETFPGVEVHANFIDNLLTGHFIRRGLRENLVDLGFLILFSLGAGLLLSVVPPARATMALTVLLGAFFWLAYYFFAAHRVWIAVFLPTSTLCVNYAGIVSYRFFFEEREKKRVRSMFGQYVAPGIIKLLYEHPDLMRLGGEEKELTAMFSDIRGFTTISEGLSPSELVDLLNEYLSEMTDIIFRNWGTLDKYIGDAIMAFWGSPYPQTDHPERACRAGLEMLNTLKKLQAKWRAEGRSEINIGIGINTGPMIVGNMGSKTRVNFTIMGDNVNLASRLEGINKQFGTRLIISETTYRAVREKMIARELDLIRVKGKMRPVKIYELLGMREESDSLGGLVEQFRTGLEAYRGGQWETAAEVFERLTSAYPQDGPSREFAKRCRDLLERPPEGAWDGVYVMKTK